MATGSRAASLCLKCHYMCWPREKQINSSPKKMVPRGTGRLLLYNVYGIQSGHKLIAVTKASVKSGLLGNLSPVERFMQILNWMCLRGEGKYPQSAWFKGQRFKGQL